MYRVMIIDDERAIRNILKKTIQWENLDMEVVGEAESGIEAVNIIDELRPHIVFLDIRMPFMNGIEFARLAKERYPRLKIIILTAFDEFEYARDCIGIGVSEYILKPIKREDINRTITAIKKQLDEEVAPEETEIQQMDTVSSKIAEYIAEHYSDKDLNLTKMAIEFGYNSSYLSRLIKREMGSTFTEILMMKRMEYAKKYAVEGMVMYLAGREVGIPDPQYFGKCFKRYVGVNYSDFEDK